MPFGVGDVVKFFHRAVRLTGGFQARCFYQSNKLSEGQARGEMRLAA